MSEIDLDILTEMFEKHYTVEIQQTYGIDGIKALQSILRTVRNLYKWVEPEEIKGRIVVFRAIKDIYAIKPDAAILYDISHVTHECSAYNKNSSFCIEICRDNSLKCSKNSLNVDELSNEAVVYLFENRQDIFVIKGKRKEVPKLSPTYASMFAIPTYFELREALEEYKIRYVRTCKCPILSEAWYEGSKGSRLLFINRPEATMRRSLSQFLDIVLRSAEVAPEQNLDETHPVDIKVTWMFCNRVALVEIKWLGRSLNKEGKPGVEFSDSRARDGAKQLVDYIDMYYRQTPIHDRKGYLVVIDGRRRYPKEGSNSIGREDGLWYAEKEIKYEPAYHVDRVDFTEPIRMFIEPIWKND